MGNVVAERSLRCDIIIIIIIIVVALSDGRAAWPNGLRRRAIEDRYYTGRGLETSAICARPIKLHYCRDTCFSRSDDDDNNKNNNNMRVYGATSRSCHCRIIIKLHHSATFLSAIIEKSCIFTKSLTCIQGIQTASTCFVL